MLTQILWWAGNTLTGLLLVRSALGRFLTKYPFFYFYQFFFLLRSLLAFYIYIARPDAYQRFYWYTEFVSVAVEYALIWEIYARALAGYAGAARIARRLLSLVLVVVVARVLANTLGGPIWSPAETTAELEAYLRSVQAILLVAILGVLVYYSIPIARNLRGMILGYGLFIGTRVLSLTLRMNLGDDFQLWWEYIQETAYCATLAIWCVGLWSYAPQPPPEEDAALERDYELLSSQVARSISLARNSLIRVLRP